MDYGFLYIYAASELGYNHSLCEAPWGGLLMSLHPLKKKSAAWIGHPKIEVPQATIHFWDTWVCLYIIQENKNPETDHDATLKNP